MIPVVDYKRMTLLRPPENTVIPIKLIARVFESYISIKAVVNTPRKHFEP